MNDLAYRATARRPDGYAVITDPTLPQGKAESDTYRCGHCGCVVHISFGPDPKGGGCYQCGLPVCEACVRVGVCSPLELYLDAHEGAPLRGRWAETFKEWNQKRLGVPR